MASSTLCLILVLFTEHLYITTSQVLTQIVNHPRQSDTDGRGFLE